jgi:hypothetical protein
MNKLTEEQALVIMAYTGVTCVNFGKFHSYAEKLLGRSIFTHEFGDDRVAAEIKEAASKDFLSICPT